MDQVLGGTMNIFSLADKYNVWSKSIIIDVLTSLGDEDFERSQSKEDLLSILNGYFVPDVIEFADLKALTQLGEAVGIEVRGKNRRNRLATQLVAMQNTMKDQALILIQTLSEDSPEFTECARIIFTTDPDLHEQLDGLMGDEDLG